MTLLKKFVILAFCFRQLLHLMGYTYLVLYNPYLKQCTLVEQLNITANIFWFTCVLMKMKSYLDLNGAMSDLFPLILSNPAPNIPRPPPFFLHVHIFLSFF
jgi:hypothetical protein